MNVNKLISKVIESVDGAGNGNEAVPTAWVSTGNFSLNKIISGDFHRGFPFGKVVEIFGDPATGKSLLLAHIIAGVQKMGGIAILDDTENAYNPFFGAKVGVDNENLIRIKSKTIEEHIEKVFIGWEQDGKKRKSIVQLLLKDDPEIPIFIGLDSLALLSTRHEQDTAFGTSDMSKAKLIKKGYRLAADLLEKHNVLYVVSNHVYYKIGVMYGNPKATPGGTGTPFQSSVRLDLVTGTRLKETAELEGDEEESKADKKKAATVGIETHITVAKNRLCPPFGKTTIEIMFDSGMDPDSGLLEVLERNKIVVKTGKGVYSFGEKTFRTSEFKTFLADNREELLKETSK